VWHDNDFVFSTTIGTPSGVSDLWSSNFWPLRERAGLPHIRIHDLRHTAATLLLLDGVHPKVVSQMLGHSSIAMTLDMYRHIVPDLQQNAATAMDRMLGMQ
jgi:integrase